jgi:hypothetical protein
MTAQIDRFSLVTAPLSLYFNEVRLSDATGFIWQEGRHAPLWLVHPARGRAVDVVAIPLPYADESPIVTCIRSTGTLQLS